uniref:WPP domain-interacting tail-anchored protein 1 n=1 Tax=Cajanus cajan TaxID=3821 RepID=A0A151S094_CAJCA|nr:WPP domain-interacting tail-anchored protein 1 [Cajanus cajan]
MSTESAEHDDASADLEGAVSSSSGNVMGDLDAMITSLGMGLDCFSEKVFNLRIFVMHVETMENEFEALVLEKGDHHMGVGWLEKGLEFDLLSVVLDSEVRELGGVFDILQGGVGEVRECVCSCTHLGEAFVAMQDRLFDYEQKLKLSEEELNDIKMQSASFQRALCSYKKAQNGEIIIEDDKSLNANAEIKMQTVEQQRHILRMLEKSLAREMDLEKNMNDSIEIQENLKLKIFFLEQGLVNMEEEAIEVWEQWLEADNACEILLGISKGLLGNLHISQFNLNCLSHRESELRASLKDAEDKVILSNSEVFALHDKVSSLENQLKESEFRILNAKASADEYQKQYNVACSKARDMESIIVELKEAVSNAESRANSAETKCNSLTQTNSKLNEELATLKGRGGTSAKVDLLEKQLKESNRRLQSAVASAKASQEKQNTLYSTIRDMENVIKDLKSKVLKAESRADSAEDNCIILSESNAELNEELSLLRSRLESLEGSLHREEEVKMTTAKDLGKQAKGFKKLLTQLAFERERLKQQVKTKIISNKLNH